MVTEPHLVTASSIVGKPVSFDLEGKRLVGVVTEAKDNGVTPRGHIPDLLVTVRGQSGAIVVVSFVESYMSIKE